MNADELYALAPEDFTAARDAAAKQARADGDRERAEHLAALRRPSVSAWLVDALARERTEMLEQLLALGPALAQAQAGGDAASLRALAEQRRELVDAVVDEAVALGGRSVSRAVRDEVAQTLGAALADPESAQAVRSGRLVRPLSYAGFGAVDLEGAVAPAPARTAPPPARTGPDAAAQRRAQELTAAEAEALTAAGRLDDAVRACGQAERALRTTQEQLADAERQREAVRAALDEADRVRQVMAQQCATDERTAQRAADEVERAQQQAEQARSRLDGLRRA